MSNEYSSRSSRRERSKMSRRSKKAFDAVEAAADKATEHLEEENLLQGRISRREIARERIVRKETRAQSIPLWVYGLLTALSALLGLTFYAFPFFHQLATPTQSQNLYSGLAMQHGLVPFNDFYGTGGSLFYLINWLGNFGGSTLFLWLFQIFALLMSGIFIYRLVAQQTKSQNSAVLVSSFSLVIVSGLARGGNAPTLLSLPFALWSVLFLSQYFHEDSTDKGFIRFGLAGAFSFVIAPVMIVFFAFSALALLIYNVSHRRFWRGFYQMLATIMGIMFVGYSVAYYALEEQTLYTSIEQSVLIPLTHFGPTGDVLLTVAKALVLTLVFGIVTGFAQGVIQLKTAGQASIWYVLLLIGTVVSTSMVVFATTFDSSNLLAVLPFTIVFAGLGIKDSDQVFLKYLQNRLFAPILAILFVALAPFAYQYLNKTTFTEEKAVAQYLQAKTRDSDRVYVLAEDKNINLLTQKVSTLDRVPAHYPLKFSQNYALNVGNIKDKYVVLEAGQAVPKNLSDLLAQDYKLVDYTWKQFKIYQRK